MYLRIAFLHILNRVGGGSRPSSAESLKTPDCQHKGMQCTTHLNAYSTAPYRYQWKSTICELLCPSSILAVKLNRKSLVIVLEMEIHIYEISNMRLPHVIETSPNSEGVLCYPSFPRESLLIVFFHSYARSITFSRQLTLGIFLPCTLSHTLLCFCFHLNLNLLLSSASIWRRPPQLDRHSPCHVLRKVGSDPGMECPRRREAVSVPSMQIWLMNFIWLGICWRWARCMCLGWGVGSRVVVGRAG